MESQREIDLKGRQSAKPGTVLNGFGAEQSSGLGDQLLRSCINSAGDAIYILDAKTGRIRDCTARACRDLGYSREELLKLSAKDIECSLTAGEIAAAHNDLDLGKVRTVKGMHERKDRTAFPVEIRLSSLASSQSNLIISIVRDVTERKRLEDEREKLQAQLRQSQKMESVGRLAGGIAHDFNNMLGVILGNVELAMDIVDPTQPLYDNLKEIRTAADRSANLTRQLLAFAQKQISAPRVLDLTQIVASRINILRQFIGDNIRLNWHSSENAQPVKIDPDQISQILINLCINACDAISGFGNITIRVTSYNVDKNYCVAHLGSVPGEYVLLAVSDDGCGMDKETLTNVFDPFFTTKDIAKGGGLGMPAIYGIVKQNKGFIDVESEPQRGTTVSIYLPMHVVKGEQSAAKDSVVQSSKRGHETILLVEDDLWLLKPTKAILEKQGYTVLAASTSREAILLARERSGEIHLLMTDVVMPGMNGRDLAKNLLSLYPHLRLLFMSGYTANYIAYRDALEEGAHFIQKPFSTKDLATKIRDVLDET